MAVENLDGVHARLDLHFEISGDGSGEFFGQRVVGFPFLAKQIQGACVFLGAAAFHHKSGQRPRRAGETEERGAVAKLFPQNPQRLVHVAQFFANLRDGKFFDVSRAAHREIHGDAAGVAESVGLSHRLGNHENVAEQNRRVETEPADRLQRHLGGEFRRLDEFEEGIFLLELAIFRQRAASLAHEPDGRAVHRPARAGVEKSLAAGHGRACRGAGGNCHGKQFTRQNRIDKPRNIRTTRKQTGSGHCQLG